MKKTLNLYFYGRSTAQGAWSFNRSLAINRLYCVNSGYAVIHNSFKEHTLTEGKIYIIPQCRDFRTVDAVDFDHTFFDFYSSRVLRHDVITELDATELSFDRFFEYINNVISADKEQNNFDALESLLSGFLSVVENTGRGLPYVTNAAVTDAVEMIHGECTEITTGLLAKRLNLNESYFIRLFGKTMGMSPMKYIRACKVLYGRELLMQGMSVAEAAEKCGYCNTSAFYKAIKAELGVSPKMLNT